MRRPWRICGVSLLTVAVVAQEPATDAGAAFAASVQRDGRLEASRWRRGSDGALEFWSFAEQEDVAAGGFVSLLGDRLEVGFGHGGLFGWLSLVCHGSADLLGMTDAAYHFTALGIEANDAGLRQFLAQPVPSFGGDRGRAELLDRLLAIDLLERRRCRPATVELAALVRDESLPPVLRDRARRAQAVIVGGTAPSVRRRLTAEDLLLPAAFDGCVVVDHARLPDMSWAAPLGRRVGALVTLRALRESRVEPSPAQCNGAQRFCDVVSELPFGFVHRFGNARLDHSVVVIQAKAGGRLPLAASWQAAGEFEAEGLRSLSLPPEVVMEDLRSGTFAVTASSLVATTDGKPGKSRPQVVERYDLLRVDDAAIRVVVPANSKLWIAARAMELPAAVGGELAITFGDPCVCRVSIAARDDQEAASWVEVARRAFATSAEELSARRGAPADHAPLGAFAAALRDATCVAEGASVRCTIEVRGVTPQGWCEAVEALLPVLR